MNNLRALRNQFYSTLSRVNEIYSHIHSCERRIEACERNYEMISSFPGELTEDQELNLSQIDRHIGQLVDHVDLCRSNILQLQKKLEKLSLDIEVEENLRSTFVSWSRDSLGDNSGQGV
jgi:chromosome segregation ATPase